MYGYLQWRVRSTRFPTDLARVFQRTCEMNKLGLMSIRFVHFEIFVVTYSVAKDDRRVSIQFRVKMHKLDFYKRLDEPTSR